MCSSILIQKPQSWQTFCRECSGTRILGVLVSMTSLGKDRRSSTGRVTWNLRVLVPELEVEVLADLLQYRCVDLLEVDLSLLLLNKAAWTTIRFLMDHARPGRFCSDKMQNQSYKSDGDQCSSGSPLQSQEIPTIFVSEPAIGSYGQLTAQKWSQLWADFLYWPAWHP